MRKVGVFLAALIFVLAATAAWAAPGEVPIGTVIDWWRPDAAWPVPDGYQVCDGSTVTDATSPLFNVALPDLTGKFVMGVTTVNNIGTTGGADSHNHQTDVSHNHGYINTEYSGTHYHSMDVPAFDRTVNTNYAGDHKHEWLRMQKQPDGNRIFVAYDYYGREFVTIIWGNGLGSEGSGIYPFAVNAVNTTYFYTTSGGYHLHTAALDHDHPAFSSASSGSHNHRMYIPPLAVTPKDSNSVSSLPPYYGLLKIMRIR